MSHVPSVTAKILHGFTLTKIKLRLRVLDNTKNGRSNRRKKRRIEYGRSRTRKKWSLYRDGR